VGAVVGIATEQGEVETTAYHPFWVLEGHALGDRPRPKELAEDEDEGLAIRGRWVNSHDLLPGDLLLTRDGRQLRVLRITQRYEESFDVCNLTIDANHSFAVGNDGLLVHNTGGCGHLGTAPRRFSPQIQNLGDDVSRWLGKDAKVITNDAGDTIIQSADGLREIRFDFNHTYPHKNPHTHLIEYKMVKNKKVEITNRRIYPAGVTPE